MTGDRWLGTRIPCDRLLVPLPFWVQGQADARIWSLAAGFLCFGLALWNKAIFVWALSGIVAGGVLVFWPEIRRQWKPRVIGVAAAAFLCGALPLVIYNLAHRSATVTENAHLDPRSVAGKWIQVENAANGSSLFGYLTGEDWRPNPKAPQSLRGRAAAWIHDHAGAHRTTGFYYVFGALLLAAPWWWKYRAARFSLVFMIVAWLLMALTHDAGTSAHHVILLWPFPILFAAIALASLPWRPVAWAAAIVMVAMNLLVLNQYVYQFERDGTGDVWTDALNPLSASLDTYADRTLYVIDWGIFENLNLLHQGRLDFRIGHDPLHTDSPEPQQLGRDSRHVAGSRRADSGPRSREGSVSGRGRPAGSGCPVLWLPQGSGPHHSPIRTAGRCSKSCDSSRIETLRPWNVPFCLKPVSKVHKMARWLPAKSRIIRD